MQNICYRCGRPIEGQIAFCAACGAPQIRVSTPEQPPDVPEKQPPDLPHVFPERPFPPSGGLARATGIAWKDFIHAATPLAAFTGIVTVPLAPLGLFVLLPANLIWAIARYRRNRPLAIRAGQGARMGAVMGVLSFGFFLPCFLAAVSLNLAKYHELIVAWVTETTSRNSDPQMQQMLQRFAAPDGMLPFTALFLATFLITFLVIGAGSGALAVALGRARNRP
jgi:riboflavin transporter FmnP